MNVREEFLPYAQPSLTHRELEEVLEAVRSLWWSRGEKCQRFEEEFAQKVGARYAVSMNSCTAALEVALCAYGAVSYTHLRRIGGDGGSRTAGF